MKILKTINGRILGLITLATSQTMEPGLQNVQSFFKSNSGPILSRVFWNQNNFAILSGIPSVLVNGFTYSYVLKESRNGEKCCRPIKSKCQENKNLNTCRISKGQVKCGKGCTKIIKALKKLERKEKKKKQKKQNASVSNKNDYDEEADGSFEEYSYEDETYEESSPQEKHGEMKYISGGGGMGLKVKEGQQLTQKQLQMLETVANEKLGAPTNPLCKDQNQMFRSL